MHMNLLQVQIKSLSAKPSLAHLGIVISSQSPAGLELPRLPASAGGGGGGDENKASVQDAEERGVYCGKY